MNIEMWPIDRPQPYGKNPRKIPDHAVDAVAVSLKEYGWQQPIVCDKADVIIVGHTRLLAAKKLGMTEVPVHVAVGLTKAQAKAYRLADNRSSEFASWDKALIHDELEGLRHMDFDLAKTLFGVDEHLSTQIKELTVQPPPVMAWVLIGLPLVRYGEISETVLKLSTIAGVVLETTQNNG